MLVTLWDQRGTSISDLLQMPSILYCGGENEAWS